MQNLVILANKITQDFDKNLELMLEQIESLEDDSLILAPEFALSGYSYENMQKSIDISKLALEKLPLACENKHLGLSLVLEENGRIYNTFCFFSKGSLIFTQSKIKLFNLNDEEIYFSTRAKKNLEIFVVNGLKIGVLICFELRFLEFWQELRGVDLILVPAMWGKERANNFEDLAKALATINQCFVLGAIPKNKSLANSSLIVFPDGKYQMLENLDFLEKKVDFVDVKKQRKLLFTGLC